jgi:hypothetical protein
MWRFGLVTPHVNDHDETLPEPFTGQDTKEKSAGGKCCPQTIAISTYVSRDSPEFCCTRGFI